MTVPATATDAQATETVARRDRGHFAGRDGATLRRIEGLVVTAILVVVTVIAVIALRGSTETARSAACTTDARMVESAAVVYRAEFGTWPAEVDALVPRYLHAPPADIAYDANNGTAACS